jgi:hypothetical protein
LAHALDQLGRSDDAREAKERARRANPAMASTKLLREREVSSAAVRTRKGMS